MCAIAEGGIIEESPVQTAILEAGKNGFRLKTIGHSVYGLFNITQMKTRLQEKEIQWALFIKHRQ